MTHRLDDSSTKRVVFMLRPKERGDVFTEEAAAKLVGQTTQVRRIDGSLVESLIEGTRLVDDGKQIALTVAVPDGIDRAPTPTEEPE